MVICTRVGVFTTASVHLQIVMNRRNFTHLLLCLMLAGFTATAQKPFTEGVIVYNVELVSPDNMSVKGVYTFSIKDAMIKKELVLENGYVDVTLLDSDDQTIYSLQNRGGKKYAIQLNMDETIKKQQHYKGFRIVDEVNSGKKLSGLDVFNARIVYPDGVRSDVSYTKEWRPAYAVTFNRFPDALFFPLNFYYNEAAGTMNFVATKMEACPVASSIFRIPAEYKIITYDVYLQLIKE